MRPLHTHTVPDVDKEPADFTLAEWQGLMEELHYQADNCGEDIYMVAHNAIRFLVDDYLARRLNA